MKITGLRRRPRPSGRAEVPVSPTASPAVPEWAEISFEERMDTVEFVVSPHAHIVVDGDQCRGCSTRACVVACPADLFVPTADGGILFNYEQCFECGTCYLVCNTAGAITWHYPEGGHGVVFKRS